MDRGAQQAALHGVAKNWTWPSDKHSHIRLVAKTYLFLACWIHFSPHREWLLWVPIFQIACTCLHQSWLLLLRTAVPGPLCFHQVAFLPGVLCVTVACELSKNWILPLVPQPSSTSCAFKGSHKSHIDRKVVQDTTSQLSRLVSKLIQFPTSLAQCLCFFQPEHFPPILLLFHSFKTSSFHKGAQSYFCTPLSAFTPSECFEGTGKLSFLCLSLVWTVWALYFWHLEAYRLAFLKGRLQAFLGQIHLAIVNIHGVGLSSPP